MKSFALVLSGGGARGYAHMGALKCLEEHGIRPSFIVGVSMGGLVGVTYALREDWFQALCNMNLGKELAGERLSLYHRRNRFSVFQFLLYLPKAIWAFFFGWGLTTISQIRALKVLGKLTQHKNLEEARFPVVVSATDLKSGNRIILSSGNAARAIYASAAIAGVFSPLNHEGYILVDGAYSDFAPVDVARKQKINKVITIDASQPVAIPRVRNGFQALMRAIDICHQQHAHLRFDKSDRVLRPNFPRLIDTLDFSARDECVAAGYQMILRNLPDIRRLLKQNNAVSTRGHG